MTELETVTMGNCFMNFAPMGSMEMGPHGERTEKFCLLFKMGE